MPPNLTNLYQYWQEGREMNPAENFQKLVEGYPKGLITLNKQVWENAIKWDF